MEFGGAGEEEALAFPADPFTLEVLQWTGLGPPAAHVMSPYHPSMRSLVWLISLTLLVRLCQHAKILRIYQVTTYVEHLLQK